MIETLVSSLPGFLPIAILAAVYGCVETVKVMKDKKTTSCAELQRCDRESHYRLCEQQFALQQEWRSQQMEELRQIKACNQMIRDSAVEAVAYLKSDGRK